MKYNFLPLLFMAAMSSDGGIPTQTAAERAEALKKAGEYPTDMRKRKTVYSTAKDPHHETGAAFTVTLPVADHLLAVGLAADTEEAAKKTASKKSAEVIVPPAK